VKPLPTSPEGRRFGADMRRPQGGTHKGESPTRPFSGGTRHYFHKKTARFHIGNGLFFFIKIVKRKTRLSKPLFTPYYIEHYTLNIKN
jgi:hypothetical protein